LWRLVAAAEQTQVLVVLFRTVAAAAVVLFVSIRKFG
jgi:hypothetical protein